jgi:hypothetical protein
LQPASKRIIHRFEYAQMAESVDALVSNTNNFGCAGSTPALGTKPLRKKRLCCFYTFSCSRDRVCNTGYFLLVVD